MPNAEEIKLMNGQHWKIYLYGASFLYLNWGVGIPNTEIYNGSKVGILERRAIKFLKRTLRNVLISLFPLISIISQSAAQQQTNIVFRDDFISKELNPRWQIIQPDKDRWTFIDNQYLMIVTAKKGANAMQFNSTLPDNYEVILKIQTPPQDNNQIVSLSLSRDDSNNVHIDYSPEIVDMPHYGSGVKFSKTLKGERSPIHKEIERLSQNTPLYLKLSKLGIEYTGTYSTDGSRWINIGKHIFIDLNGKPTFEAYNWPTIWSKPPEAGIRFDYFEIRKLDQ
jgi:hypothetical protein